MEEHKQRMASARRLFVHLVMRDGKTVWKSGIRAEAVKRVLMSWPNHNAGITQYPQFNELRVDQFQRARKWLPMTHAVLIDPQRDVIKHWIKTTGQPAIHVSKQYPPNKNTSFPWKGIGRVNVSSLYNDSLPSYTHIRGTYQDYDPTLKPPLIVPVYGIRSLCYLHHVLDDLMLRLRYAITDPTEIKDEHEDAIHVYDLDKLKFKADKL